MRISQTFMNFSRSLALVASVAARYLSVALLFSTFNGKGRAEIISNSRSIVWAPHCGVPGGIPNRTVVFTTLNPGATAAQINSAIANCPPNQVVKLSAGTYNLSSIVNLGARNDITLRGAGQGQTIINSTSGNSAITTDQYGPSGAQTISSGYTKDSTSIVVPNGSAFAAGNLMLLSEQDDTDFVLTSGSPGRRISFTTRVTGVNGNTITFSPPLPWGFTASLSPQAAPQTGGIRRTGIEDMTIVGSGNATDIIQFWGAYACWIKNVELRNANNSFIFFYGSLQCEVRHCYAHTALGWPNNTDGYGVYLYGNSTYCLVEDNIFKNMASIAATGASANAFVYNVCIDSNLIGWGHQMGMMNASHGAHPMMTLWEGNTSEQWQADGYHGSSSHQVLFRNWFHGLHSTKSGNRKMIDLCRGNYYCSVVGNVLGDESWTNYPGFAYEMVGQPGYTQAAVIYRFGYPNMANNGTNASDVVNPWPLIPNTSYPDVKVKNTLLRHGNYDWKNRSIVWDSNIPDRTIPPSLFYSSKPAYFGSCPWPPFDPASPSSTKLENIPAGYRYVHGVDPPTGPVNQSPSAVANATPTAGLPPLAVTFSSAGSSDPEGTPVTYNWNFGDGTPISTAANPSHTYANAGNYNAQLTVSDGVNSTVSSQINITVGNRSPVATASANPVTGLPPLVVTFSSAGSSDPDGTPITYSWNFGDGTPVSTVANPSHTYANAGSYVARLTVADGVNSTLSSAINIAVGNQPPIASASANPLSGPPPHVVTFSSAGSSDPENTPLSYNWNFGDGATSTQANPSHTYGALGTYTATLTVSDGSNTATKSLTIIVSNARPGLVAAYGCRAVTGAVLDDNTGNGVTGTINGAIWTAAGHTDGGMSFNGVGDDVTLGNPTALKITGSMTLQAWVKATGTPADDGQIIAKSGDSNGWQLKTSPDTGPRKFAIAISPPGGGRIHRFSNTTVALNTWYHVAGVYNSATQTLDIYVNGVLDNGVLSGGTIPTSQLDPSLNAMIGQRNGGFNFAGVIDDVRIYNRALSAGEVMTDKNTPVVPSKPKNLRVAGQ